jgi:hypothetical protein
MILRVTDKTGDTVVDTATDFDLARELFAKANLNGMWGKGIKGGQSEFIPNGAEFDNLDYDEVVMFPRQVGG